MPERHHVVVDGSNLATEGRTLPSLAQLDEAVRAYVEEDPDADIVVVVDASFEHRIDASEREQLEEAELHGEVVSPPAGAIGRGDAFVLRIAERTGATVLSNDSFQEFHAEHPWLFDANRLIGGKPVPGVGWIFTPRNPVRGPKSRQATAKARRDADLPASARAAELATATQAAKLAPVHPDGSTPKVGDVWGATVPDGELEATETAPPAKATKKASKKVVAAADGDAVEPTPAAAAKATKATKKATKKASKKSGAPGDAAEAPAADEVEAPATAAKATKKATKKVAKKATAAKKAAATATPSEPDASVERSTEEATVEAAPPPRRGARRSAAEDDQVLRAIDDATAEALAPPEPAPPATTSRSRSKRAAATTAEATTATAEVDDGGPKRRRRATTPPPAVNEPLAFITFVATYPLGSEVDGEVVSFTSHGAMVDVGLPDGGLMHCYVPLSGLGDPAPTKAREVISRGEQRPFVLIGLDPPRRVAELALPGIGGRVDAAS